MAGTVGGLASCRVRSDLPVNILQTLIRETMIKLPLKPALNKHAVIARLFIHSLLSVCSRIAFVFGIFCNQQFHG